MADVFMRLFTEDVEIGLIDEGLLFRYTRIVTSTDFRHNEDFCAAYDETVHALFHDEKHGFHNHAKHALIYFKADFFVVGFNEENEPVGFALVVAVGEKWMVEYVMTHPDHRGKKIAHNMMNRILYEAPRHRIRLLILNCTPSTPGHPGLDHLYEEFGFSVIK